MQHNDVHFYRWRELQVPGESKSYSSLPKTLEALDALEAEMVVDQRAKAKPIPHRFELVPR